MLAYTPEVLGIAGSVVIALLSLVPALGATDQRRNILAIVVLLFAALLASGFEFTTWQVFLVIFGKAALSALVAYKMFIQNFILIPAQKAVASSSEV